LTARAGKVRLAATVGGHLQQQAERHSNDMHSKARTTRLILEPEHGAISVGEPQHRSSCIHPSWAFRPRLQTTTT
jgi:hypothetical protein